MIVRTLARLITLSASAADLQAWVQRTEGTAPGSTLHHFLGRLFKDFWPLSWVLLSLIILRLIFRLMLPLALGLFLTQLETPTWPAWLMPLSFPVLIFLQGWLGELQTYALQFMEQTVMVRINQQMMSQLMDRGAAAATEPADFGRLVSHALNDSQNLAGALGALVTLGAHCLLLIASSMYVFALLHWGALGIPLTLGLLLLWSRWLGTRFAILDARCLAARDSRLQLWKEMYEAWRTIRILCAEKAMQTAMNFRRDRERDVQMHLLRTEVLTTIGSVALATLLSLFCFGIHTGLGGSVSASLVFSCLAVFILMDEPFSDWPQQVARISSAQVAWSRFAELFQASSGTQEASRSWPQENLVQQLSQKTGDATAVIGPSGSGKSLLIRSLLATVREQVIHVPQSPRVWQGSLAENLAFGQARSRLELEWAADLCQLKCEWPDGLDHPVVSGGVNLSGGQCQRLALARACLCEGDFVVLDDAFSALDPRTAEDLHQRLIFDLWRDKTRFVVTSRHTDLKKYDRVIACDQMQCRVLSSTEVDALVLAATSILDMTAIEAPSIASESLQRTAEPEVMSHGQRSWTQLFDRSARRLLLGACVVLALASAAPLIQDLYLARWAQGVLPFPNSVSFHLSVYAGLGFLALLLAGLQHFIWGISGLRVACDLHEKIFSNFLHLRAEIFSRLSPAWFLSRISQHLSQVESNIIPSLMQFSYAMFACLSQLILVACSVPWLILGAILLGATLLRVQKFFQQDLNAHILNYQNDLSRWLQSFYDTLKTRDFIVTHRREKEFLAKLSRELWGFVGWEHRLICDRRRLALALNTRVTVFLGLVSCSIAWSVRHGDLSLAIAAVILTQSLQLTPHLALLLRAQTDVKNQQLTADRIVDLLQLPLEKSESSFTLEPMRNIVFKNCSLTYGNHGGPVLTGLDLQLSSGRWTGIVGPSGSGKSTLLHALFGMAQISAGTISVGETNLAGINTSAVRRGAGWITQDSQLLPGPLRLSLDPTSRHDDEDILQALRDLEAPAFGLHDLSREWLNIEQGSLLLTHSQRVLILLARSRLEGHRWIFLDEISASLQPEALQKLHGIIRKEFVSVNVVSISHRPESLQGFHQVITLTKKNRA